VRYYQLVKKNQNGEEISSFTKIKDDKRMIEELQEEYDDVRIMEEVDPEERECRICGRGTAQYRICAECQKILVEQNVVEDSLYE